MPEGVVFAGQHIDRSADERDLIQMERCFSVYAAAEAGSVGSTPPATRAHSNVWWAAIAEKT